MTVIDHLHKGERVIRRGEFLLPHQAQMLARDLYAEELIEQRFGPEANGYRMTAEQVEDRRLGRGPSHGLPYEFLITTSAHTSWTAFYTRADMQTWLDAYGVTIDHEPEEGERFKLNLPSSPDAFKPLVGVEGWWVTSVIYLPTGQREEGPFDTREEAERRRDVLQPRFHGSAVHRLDVERVPCECVPGSFLCPAAEELWRKANTVYDGEGLEHWKQSDALHYYHRHQQLLAANR